MQRGEETTTMPPKNIKASSEPGFDNTFSSEITKAAQKGSKNSKSDDSAQRNSSSLPITSSATAQNNSKGTVEGQNSSGRERLRKHRVEVAGRVWIPEMWGQEAFLKDWIDSTVFDSKLANSSIMSARVSLVEEGRRPNSTTFTIENSC
ncbi:hypothetical protein ACP275_12G152300 [Erythranthe tilingii]